MPKPIKKTFRAGTGKLTTHIIDKWPTAIGESYITRCGLVFPESQRVGMHSSALCGNCKRHRASDERRGR